MQTSLILSAALIGFSFSNTFVCTAIAMSVSIGKSMAASISFLIGRVIGVIALGFILALFGFYIEIDTRLMLYLFGGLTIIFGLIILTIPSLASKMGLLKNCEIGSCSDCNEHEGKEYNCSDCSSSGNCPGSSSSAQDKKRKATRIESFMNRFGKASTFILGFVRGATPCIKILLLVPLIISLPLLESLAVTTTYALSSSLYTIMGISIAIIIGNFSPDKFKKYLTRVGAVSMIMIGVYFIHKAWTYSCEGGF